jgi:hypothetical protein
MDNQTSSKSPTVENHIDESMNSEHIKLEISSDKRTTDLNEETTSAFINHKVHPSVHISKLPDEQNLFSPIKLVSLPERKLSQEKMPIMNTNDPLTAISAISSPIVYPSMIKPSPSKREKLFSYHSLKSFIYSIYQIK